MEQRSFNISALELTIPQTYAVEGLAAEVLRACHVEISPDDSRSPFAILTDLEKQLNPELVSDAKVAMLAIAAGIMPPITNQSNNV